MAERDTFKIQGDIHCPRCWRLNPATATFCEECGAELIPAPEPVIVKAAKVKRDKSWLRGYAVACWLIMVLAVVIGGVVGMINFLTPGRQGTGLLLMVCGLALAALHLIVGKGLWLQERWAESTAYQMHGITLIYLLLQLVVAIVHPNIPYLGTVLSTPVLLALIGGLALWVGARAEEGERLAVNGPDPNSVAEITSAPVKIVNTELYPARANVPPTTDPPIVSVYRVNPQRNDSYQPTAAANEENDGPSKLEMSMLAIGANLVMGFINRRKTRAEVKAEVTEEVQQQTKKAKPARRDRHNQATKRSKDLSKFLGFFKD